MSKGEEKIAKILEVNNLKFKREVTFPDLKGIKNNLLRFDFGVYENGNLLFLIEMDGAQHFSYNKHFHKNISNFNRAREWDRKKNSYCLIHQIPLIRIPYWSLDQLTLVDLLKNPDYRVTNKWHQDDLIWNRG